MMRLTGSLGNIRVDLYDEHPGLNQPMVNMTSNNSSQEGFIVPSVDSEDDLIGVDR